MHGSDQDRETVLSEVAARPQRVAAVLSLPAHTNSIAGAGVLRVDVVGRREPLQPTIPHFTRSSLHRCLEHPGIARRPEVGGDKPRRAKFKR